MTWLSDNAEAIRLLATIVGLIGGLIGFFKFYDQKRSEIKAREKAENEEAKIRKEKRNEQWLQTAVYSLFQTRDAEELSFEEIRKEIAHTNFFDKTVDLEPKDLDDVELRRLIVNMIAMGVIEQVGGDCYVQRLKTEDPSKKAMRMMLNNNALVPKIENILEESPKSLMEIRAKLRDSGIEISRFQLASTLQQMTSYELLSRVQLQGENQSEKPYWVVLK